MKRNKQVHRSLDVDRVAQVIDDRDTSTFFVDLALGWPIGRLRDALEGTVTLDLDELDALAQELDEKVLLDVVVAPEDDTPAVEEPDGDDDDAPTPPSDVPSTPPTPPRSYRTLQDIKDQRRAQALDTLWAFTSGARRGGDTTAAPASSAIPAADAAPVEGATAAPAELPRRPAPSVRLAAAQSAVADWVATGGGNRKLW